MSDVPQTPNLDLNLPTPDVYNLTPSWGELLNQNFQLLDSAVPSVNNPLTPAEFNINRDLDFGGWSATNIGAVSFLQQDADPVVLESIYFKSLEFYVYDGAGNAVQITSNGSVAAAAGNIGGNPGTYGAGISWDNGQGAFIFTGAGGNVRPSLQVGPLALYDSAAGPPANAVILKSRASLVAGYSYYFPPSLPASTLPLVINSSGQTSASTITRRQQAAVGQQVSPTFGFVSNVPGNITGMMATITTTGRPVVLGLMGPQTTGAIAYGRVNTNAATVGLSVAYSGTSSGNVAAITLTALAPPSAWGALVVLPAGTYVFQGVVGTIAVASFAMSDCVFYAYEL